MVLIACPECKRDVSSKAPSCPHCGSPIAGTTIYEELGVNLQTVQTKSKELKRDILICVALFWGGVLLSFYDVKYNYYTHDNAGIAVLMMGFGAIGYIFTKIRIWWHHR